MTDVGYPTGRVAVALVAVAVGEAVQLHLHGPASPLFWGPLLVAVPAFACMALSVATIKPPGVPSDEQLNRALRAYDEFVKRNVGESGFIDNEHLHMGALAMALTVASRPSPWSPRGWYYYCAAAAWMLRKGRS